MKMKEREEGEMPGTRCMPSHHPSPVCSSRLFQALWLLPGPSATFGEVDAGPSLISHIPSHLAHQIAHA